jgi:hypothetical protein
MITSGTSRCAKSGDASTTRLEQGKLMAGIEYLIYGVIGVSLAAIIAIGIIVGKK